jgi:CelD/BcsL family acetyltransferase involved in cellulose biosynthesis
MLADSDAVNLARLTQPTSTNCVPYAAAPVELEKTRTSLRQERLSVTVAHSAAELADHTAALDDLATVALEPNVFYEPWMFLPAVEAYAADSPLQFVLIYNNSGKLCGFFPLELGRRWRGLPVRVARIWRHVHCVLGTPLVRADQARECWAFLLHWLAKDRNGAALLELPFVTGDGPFQQLLIDDGHAHGLLSFCVESFTRALFRAHRSGDEYLAEALSSKHSKELKRQERRLSEFGPLHYETLGSEGDTETWINAFLELEARGWKGRKGTALVRQDSDRRFFQTFCREAARRGRLQMLGLFLGNRTIAIKCNLLAGEGAIAFKIAFDEDFARHSPGVLLELFTIKHLHGQPGPIWMDSCAIPDHPMINRLWLDRRTIQTLLISTGRRPGDFVVSMLPALRWLKRSLKRK